MRMMNSTVYKLIDSITGWETQQLDSKKKKDDDDDDNTLQGTETTLVF